MNAIYKSSVPKKLTDKLNGEITIPEFIIIFKSVMDEKFDLLFWFSKKQSFKKKKKKKKKMAENLCQNSKEKWKAKENVLKDLPLPTPATVPPTPNEEKEFLQMSQEELDMEVHKIVMQQFSFARTLALALNDGKDNKKLEKLIIQESIKELEYLLRKK